MSCKPDLETTVEMYVLYKTGRSLEEVGTAFSVSRQSVFDRFRRRGLKLRPKKTPLPFIEWNKFRYTLRKNGYYAKTNGNRSSLHCDMWTTSNGPIPKGMDVHHKDENKQHNTLDNFELIDHAEHTRLFGHRGNQHTKARREQRAK